jgi:two-component system, sensor histidine kinase and response regulator
LILVDTAMPRMDGTEFLKRVGTPATPFGGTRIVMTPPGQAVDGKRCAGLGPHLHIAKPIDPSELLTTIRAALGKPGGRPAPRPSASPPEPARPLRILVAEDNVVNQRVASAMLRGMGHTATIVGDGVQALERLREQPFDLVLMDVQMPEMDGFAAARAIRDLERKTGGHLPIIAMTAHAMKGDEDRCMKAGMDDYVSKPVSRNALAAAIERTANFPGAVPTPSDAARRFAITRASGG